MSGEFAGKGTSVMTSPYKRLCASRTNEIVLTHTILTCFFSFSNAVIFGADVNFCANQTGRPSSDFALFGNHLATLKAPLRGARVR
jgi:hypothetical protein